MEDKPNKTTDREYYLFALRIVGDFGASIAIPVVVFVLIGHYFDEKYHHAPWFTVIGFALAALSSGKIIYKKARKYGEEYQAMNRK
ncbi:MAG: AtpZ/AtpI family protein [Candidatus Magasanikbacteria bacterium]|nr:AtpZ/AtpI family protein [Candidatus Magasanikbacteria bacterium]